MRVNARTQTAGIGRFVSGKVLRWSFLLALLMLMAPLAWFSVSASLREVIPAGRSGEPGSYATVGDVDIHYRSWGPSAGTPVLLIHGTLAWSATWYEVAERLAASGYRVIAPDLPPFGFSSRPDSRDYSRAAQAHLILDFADALGLKTFALAGHSFGGGATIEAAFSAPQRILGLVLLDVAVSLDDPAGNGWISTLYRAPIIGRVIAAATFANPVMTAAGLRNFIADDTVVTPQRVALYQQPLAVDATSAAVADWVGGALFSDERQSQAADAENYRRFDRPTIIIWGRQDTVTPLAQGMKLRSLLPRSTLLVLDGVNHIPHVENPDAVALAIAEFVGGLEAGAMLPQALLRRPGRDG